ncbi:MAG: hypothetical protein JSS16_15480 [Proteobacteria bacterium]|uniref:hypothetical protein n=1 Tax=Rudaea sp. TaxID=2136325 RepID=UPI001D7851FD|nr:hypothetical protein [Pseudomonadota bacterium]MBS0568451.1 hypothetical protein [Pseudomonadota bacterium]
MRIARLSILVLATLSVSCARSTPPPAPAPAEPAKPEERQKTVIDAQLKAIDKAKAVQDTVDQQKKDMDKKLEDAGG